MTQIEGSGSYKVSQYNILFLKQYDLNWVELNWAELNFLCYRAAVVIAVVS